MSSEATPRRRFATPLDLTDVDDRFRDRFWSKVDQRGPDECWPWMAYCKPQGYGQFVLRKGVFTSASRVSLALTIGRPLEPGEQACHTCDNPPCCNPAHLFAGSASDNIVDCVNKGRKNPARGEQQGAAKLTEAEVLAILAEPTYYGVTRVLSRRYGVSDTVIRRIRLRSLWAHLDAETNTTRLCTKGHPLTDGNLLPAPDPSARTPCAICAETFRAGRLVRNRRAA